MNPSGPQLSKTRTFLLWALAVVWFSEMTLWGVRPLSEVWTRFWQQLPPEHPQLADALFLTHAFESAAKGALGVLAVFALRSRSPAVRTALFVPMGLVPPLNLAFQFRAQGFPLGPTTVGAVLSTILWGSFFLFRDVPEEQEPGTNKRSEPSTPSRWGSFQSVWLGANALLLTLVASLFLFAPETGVRSTFPCLADLLDPSRGVPPGLTHSLMAVGTHLMAVSIAGWIAAVSWRSGSAVRQALIAAMTLQAGLLCALPLRQLALEFGRDCAASSLLIYALPLFAAWVIYVALAHGATRLTGGQLARAVGG